MKNIYKTLIFVLSLSLVLLTTSFVLGFKPENIKEFFSGSYRYTPVDQVVIQEEITQITVDVTVKNIIIEAYDQSFITVDHYLKKGEIVEINYQNKELSIHQRKNFNIMNFINFQFIPNNYEDIIVKVPYVLLENITIQAETGNIKLSNLTAKNITIHQNTGNTTLNHLTVENNITLKATTGNVYVNELKAQSQHLTTTTGNVKLKNIETTDLTVNITTGNMELIQVISENIILKSSTGNIYIKGSYPDHQIHLKTTTGGVRVNGKNEGNSYSQSSLEPKQLKATTTTGNIKLESNS